MNRGHRGALAVAAVLPLALALPGCHASQPQSAAASTATPSAASPPSATATHTHEGGESPAPLPTATVPHDATAEVAERFKLPKTRLDEAVIAARVEMVRIGGEHGEKLTGVPDGGPLDQGRHLDRRILAVFTATLQVPQDQGVAVLKALIAEWNEYDEQAEQQRPGAYTKAVAADARLLKISTDRARWIESLLISRAALGTWPAIQDPIFDAVARSLHVSTKELAAAVDYTKTH